MIRKAMILTTILIALGLSLWSQQAEVVGEIQYLDGYVDLHRDGEIIELFPSDIGFTLEAVDTIQTGDDGFVEFELSNLQTGGTNISVGNNTVFRIESSLSGGASRTRFEVFSGSLSLKVAKLSGRERLSVQTESAVMGVRGTEFEVVTAPDGSVLVLCEEGSVSCVDENDNEEFAGPGRGVQKLPGDPINGVGVDEDEYDQFRTNWQAERLSIFRSGAPVFIRAYVRQNQRLLPRFNAAYRRIESFETRLRRYAQANESGNPPSRGELMRFRAEISPAFIEMRSIIPIYRQNFFRLVELRRYVIDEGLAADADLGEIRAGEYFRRFSSNLRAQRERIARVEYWTKLYLALGSREDDSFGGESLMDEFFAPGESSLLEEF